MPPHNARRFKIVLVDDDPETLVMYAEIIQGWFSGAEITTFDKPHAALEELAQRNPDILITGVKMPRMDGYELMERLWAKNVQYPILVLTAYGPAQEWVERHAHEGLNVRYHSKPGSEQELASLRRSMELALKVSGSATKRVDLKRQKSVVADQSKTTPSESGLSAAVPPKSNAAGQQLCKRKPRRVVVMDDEPYVGEALAMVIPMEFVGTEVVTFTVAAKALEELLREPPDLFTTDWHHPGQMCPAIFKQLLQRKERYPIFVMSADSDRIKSHGVLREFTDAGLDITLIAKPFRLEELRPHFAKALGISAAGTPKPEAG